ncbi:hypothetical protein AB0G20_28005 [Streptomyces sp. NPDC024017]|uniref:hypothetical protein n=1 Tax=Streptomyces sp. NPDC024017 TaxID=3154326 RepID=UPI0033F2E031
MTTVLALRGLPAEPLLTAGAHDASLALAVSLVAEADALVVAAPISQGLFTLDRHITTAPNGAAALDHDEEWQLAHVTDQFARALASLAHLTAA